ncbi:MAG: hypothetical protein UX17_C0065G0009 [Parcubacteria group bacterium GW2011_GWC2_45_7]|nr:MAG: hypothetical protein UX17_C0065G0009 [Parcubacteria group bacterium GW2011_GWC2_45_7]KKU73370.1 MAG: hypothetical protein UX98_C0008G0036 [Parcubacteria group bacterium GW2011_GWA2_47_26]
MSEELHNLNSVNTSSTAGGTITLRVPKLNWQIVALILIALVAGLQTAQLARLKGAVSVRPAQAASSGGAAPAAASGNGLQSMVGGC